MTLLALTEVNARYVIPFIFSAIGVKLNNMRAGSISATQKGGY